MTDLPGDSCEHRKRMLCAMLDRADTQVLRAGLYVVATPIGNLADMTVRAASALARAQVVYCEDSRLARRLLEAYGLRPNLKTYHEHSRETVRDDIVAQIAQGGVVALISDAGTPLICDPGYRLVNAVRSEGLDVFTVPGPSAMSAALSIAGLATDSVLFLGFLPQKSGARRSRLDVFRETPATLIIYEAPHRLVETLGDLADQLGPRRAVVARELTKRFEAVEIGDLTDLASRMAVSEVKGEIVIVIAPPAERGTQVSDADIVARFAVEQRDSSPSQAAKATAKALGVSKSRVYDLAVAGKTGCDGTDGG